MKRALSVFMFVLLLLNTLTFAFNTQNVKASGTIYIRADGSIDPPETPISTVDNVTYTLTDNVYETIRVERSNIIIDGNGYTLQGSGSGDGFHLSDINNVTITRTNIKGFSPLWYGIIVTRSFNISICGNNIMNNSHYGIGLFASHNNICDNNITGNDRGIGLYSSHDNFVVGNNFANNVYGIRLGDSSDNIFYHNNFINNEVQVYDENIPKSINIWDNGYPSGGNYWSDYLANDSFTGPYQNVAGSDGIGDAPYSIDENNVDRYPLVRPWKPITVLGDINHDGAVNILDIVQGSSIYGCREGEPNWNPDADIAPPWNVINIYDIVTIVSHYGQTTP